MMKSAPFIIKIFALALLFGCCQASLAQTGEAKLPHSMKGYELYSWKSRGEWYFSLLVGTNRLKTFKEVSSTRVRLRGVEALKRKLKQLAEGEEVLWSDGLVPHLIFPPEKFINQIKSYCEEQRIILRVNRRRQSHAALQSLDRTAR